MRFSRSLLYALVLTLWSGGAARASKWTGPTLLVVEAQGFERIPCPRGGVLSAGKDGPSWVLPTSGVCLKARWRLLEAHNKWPQAMTDAFLERMGKHVYLSGPAVPSGPTSLLLVPGPVYAKRGPMIVGTSIRPRLLGTDQHFAQLEVNLLQPANDRVYGDTLRLGLRWTGWKKGSIAAGPASTTDLTVLLRRSCLPGPVDLDKCAAYAGIGRSGSDAIPSTIKVKGVLDFASPPTNAPLAPFAGALLLDAPLDGDGGSTDKRCVLYLRVAGGDLEEALLPAGLRPLLAGMGPTATKKLGSVLRCQQSVARLARGASAADANEVARACADLYGEPACAQAMRNPPADPSTRAATIARACRDAYCPRLAEPRPALCQRSELPVPTQLLTEHGELMRRALAFELGVSPELLAPLFAPRPPTQR
jgi:hypothetical protein